MTVYLIKETIMSVYRMTRKNGGSLCDGKKNNDSLFDSRKKTDETLSYDSFDNADKFMAPQCASLNCALMKILLV